MKEGSICQNERCLRCKWRDCRTRRNNDAVARNPFTSAWPLLSLHNFKWKKLCGLASAAYRHRFQNFTRHSNVLKAQLTVAIHGPSTVFIRFSACHLVQEQITETLFFSVESPDLCSFWRECGNQRFYLKLDVMKLFLYTHALIGVLRAEASCNCSRSVANGAFISSLTLCSSHSIRVRWLVF